MAKKIDPLKAKQKKQKIIAAVLGVVFLGVLAFEVPSVLKRLHPPPPPHSVASTTTTTPTGTPSLAAPTLQGAAAGPATTPTPAAGPLASGTTTVQEGQLASFSRFASKDPFAQQLSEHASGSSSSSGTGSKSNPDKLPAIPGNSPAPGGAVISVNGTLYDVVVGTDFPVDANDPNIQALFHLVALTAHTARIAIAGGSYSNGSATVTLKENKSVTLMNTADGTRYKLVLKPQGTTAVGSGSSGGASTTPATVTLPAATP